MGISQYDERLPFWTSRQLSATDGTASQPLEGASSSGTRLDSLIAVTNAASPVVIAVSLYVTVDLAIGQFTVPAAAGNDPGAPPFDVLGAMRTAGMSDLVIPPDGLLRVRVTAALGGGITLTLIGIGGYI